MWSDPDVVRHISGKPSSEAESWARLLRYAGHWNLLGFGYWAVEDRTTGMFIGEVGFADHRRDIDPPFDGIPEAGWVMAVASHGRGLAREAIRAALEWADANLSTKRTVCMIAPEHERSLRLARDVGYGHERYAQYRNKRVIVLERRNTL
jgi:RimJ/RimL family protein N-acetyltransferase